VLLFLKIWFVDYIIKARYFQVVKSGIILFLLYNKIYRLQRKRYTDLLNKKLRCNHSVCEIQLADFAVFKIAAKT